MNTFNKKARQDKFIYIVPFRNKGILKWFTDTWKCILNKTLKTKPKQTESYRERSYESDCWKATVKSNMFSPDLNKYTVLLDLWCSGDYY